MNTQLSGETRLSQRARLSEGQPISDLMGRALANPELISLAAGFVDQQTLPVEALQKAFAHLFSDESHARRSLQYGMTHGDGDLRHALLHRLRESDGKTYDDLDPNRLVLSAGSNQMLQLIADTLLDAGDIVICSSPTYLVFMGILGGVGARSYGVAMDEQGMIPESLDHALAQLDKQGELHKVKAVYLVSYYDNPSGVLTTGERRRSIVEITKKWSTTHQIYVIEDAAYRELRYEGEDLPSARSFDEEGDTVINTGSFSKSFSPGVRVGWGILPTALIEPVMHLKGNTDFGSPNLNQMLMARVVGSDLYDSHINKLREGYSAKRNAMLSAVEEFLAPISGVSWVRPTGGLYVWVTLPEGMDAGPDGQLFDTSIEEGVLYVPGQYCFPAEGEPIQKNTIRLSFGVQTSEKIHDGIAALARAIKKC